MDILRQAANHRTTAFFVWRNRIILALAQLVSAIITLTTLGLYESGFHADVCVWVLRAGIKFRKKREVQK